MRLSRLKLVWLWNGALHFKSIRFAMVLAATFTYGGLK
jgi:hypothetical protein